MALRRLSGKPDARSVFVNLECLRDHVERTGEAIEQYRFDVPIDGRGTERQQARILPESHHVEQLEARLTHLEAAFAEGLGRARN